MKHFIPLWGQQHAVIGQVARQRRNISYPSGDSNGSSSSSVSGSKGNISYPYGDSNATCAGSSSGMTGNISYPYGDSNALSRTCSHSLQGNISYPYGDSNDPRPDGAGWCSETFHTPMGTKRKPICPIGHIGFYFIRYCYSHVTPPIPSAVLMPTPAYGAKCSSRFAIVR